MAERLYTVREAAGVLTISGSGMYDLVARSLIRHVRVSAGGGGIRIPESAVQEYLASRTVGPATVATSATRQFRFVKLPKASSTR